jgi:outer membrane lipoprotein SlyB
MRKEKVMKKNSSIKAALVPCILAAALISLLCFPATTHAQAGSGAQSGKSAAKPPAYTPPPDLMIYFRTGPREKSIGVQVTNDNVPGLPRNLNYLKQTVEYLEDNGYEVPENPARAAVQVRVTAKYNQVDNSQRVAKETGARAVTGAVLGVLGGLASGGGGQGAAQGAAGGAAAGAASGSDTPLVVKYLTLEFEISSSKGGTQTGQVTKDMTNIDLRPDEFIDVTIAEYLDAAFPKKR